MVQVLNLNWLNTYLFAKSNWKQIESILISISKSWKGWTHVAYYYKHSKSLGDIFCGCDMIPLHKRRSGLLFFTRYMTWRFSSQLRKKEVILPIGLQHKENRNTRDDRWSMTKFATLVIFVVGFYVSDTKIWNFLKSFPPAETKPKLIEFRLTFGEHWAKRETSCI